MFIFRREFCGMVIFDCTSLKYFYIDEPSSVALEYLLETRDKQGLFYNDFVEADFIDKNFNLNGKLISPVTKRKGMLIAPITVFMQVTELCPLNCRHCFTKSNKNETEMTMENIFSLIDHLADIGVCELVIGGGEPFARQDILGILEYASSKDVIPSITTNGILLNDKLLDDIAKLKLGYLKFSIDGTERYHDYIRGTGSYRQTISNLKLALAKGIKNVGVRMVINSANYQSIQPLYEELKLIGCESLSFSIIRPSGNATQNTQLYDGITKEVFYEIIHAVKKIKANNDMNIRFSEDAPFISGFEREESIANILLPGFGCPIRGTVCEIDAHGNVSPCGFLKGLYGDSLIAGNVLAENLIDIWNHSEVFLRFREMPPPRKCVSCAYKSSCSGGCRTRAFQMFGDYTAHDPLCFL